MQSLVRKRRGVPSPALRWLLMIGVAWCRLSSVPDVSADESSPRVDPEIRQAIDRHPVRVLVEFRMPLNTDATSPSGSAIATARREVLSRLPRSHFSVLREFETVPFLALEIDAEALRALEHMSGLVRRVVPDRPLAPTRP